MQGLAKIVSGQEGAWSQHLSTSTCLGLPFDVPSLPSVPGSRVEDGGIILIIGTI
jgi:hypothetical protein